MSPSPPEQASLDPTGVRRDARGTNSAEGTDGTETTYADEPDRSARPHRVRRWRRRWRRWRCWRRWRRWRRWRWPALVSGALLVLLAIAVALAAPRSQRPLDPEASNPEGARAIAQLLGDRGVEVERVDRFGEAVRATSDAGDDTTVVVSNPDMLTANQSRRLSQTTSGDLVLLAPGDTALDNLDVPALSAGASTAVPRSPGCDLRPARRAGGILVSGEMYRPDADVAADSTGCYGDGSRSTLLQIPGTGTESGTADAGEASNGAVSSAHSMTVLGSPGVLANNRLDQRGHAALGLNLLGRHDRLVWYVPSPADLPTGRSAGGSGSASVADLVPDGVRMGIAQIAVAVVLLMIASARRLGPVVSERLPVVVRASEAVEGRARLYRRGRAREQVAAHLRAASRARLAPVVGLPATADRQSLLAAVAAHAHRPPAELEALLYGSMGADPSDDAALVRLADDLDALEQEVRRS